MLSYNFCTRPGWHATSTGVDTHAHVDPGYKLGSRSLKILHCSWLWCGHILGWTCTGVGIFWGTQVGIFWGGHRCWWHALVGPQVGIFWGGHRCWWHQLGACPGGPLSGQACFEPGPALPPYKGRGSPGLGPTNPPKQTGNENTGNTNTKHTQIQNTHKYKYIREEHPAAQPIETN